MNVQSAMDVGMFVLPAIAVMGRATANILTKTGIGFVTTAINVMVDVKLMSNVPVVNMQGRLAIVFFVGKRTSCNLVCAEQKRYPLYPDHWERLWSGKRIVGELLNQRRAFRV